ncbi:MAG: GSU2204 family outer membrane beta-barrel protein, partial [Candidatus Zixiibacteriota bacterium]
MRKSIIAMFLGFLLILGIINTGIAQETENKYSLWIGTHYSDFQDNNKKVAEYELGKNQLFPEFRFSLLSKKNDGNLFRLHGNYFDQRNYGGKLNSYMGDRINFEVEYKTSIKQSPYDSLSNMETREAGGGKILTHELMDEGSDYKVY